MGVGGGKTGEVKGGSGTSPQAEGALWSEAAMLGRVHWRYPAAAAVMGLSVLALVFWPGSRGPWSGATSTGNLDVRFLLTHGFTAADLPAGVAEGDQILVVPRLEWVLRDPRMRVNRAVCRLGVDLQVWKARGRMLPPIPVASPSAKLRDAAVAQVAPAVTVNGEPLEFRRGYAVRWWAVGGLAAQWLLAGVVLVCPLLFRGALRDLAALRRLASGGCARCGFPRAGERCAECGLVAPWRGEVPVAVGLGDAAVDRLRRRVRGVR